MTEDIKPYFASKSGKKCTIQHGSCWYEEHDTAQFNIFKVLVDSIPKGQPGHIRHCDALRTLRRFMKTARFGSCTQSAYMIRIGKGAMREESTYLLNKYQFLVMAAALSDEYLQLAVTAQYNNLSAEELAMDSFEFMRMIKKQADSLLDEAASAEATDQTIVRADALIELDNLLEKLEDSKADFIDADDPKLLLQLAQDQVDAFQLGNTEYSLPDGYQEYAEARLKAAMDVHDVVSKLLNTPLNVQLDTATSTIERLRGYVPRVNSALLDITSLAEDVADPEAKARYFPFTNKHLREEAYPFGIGHKQNTHMFYSLKRLGIDAGQTNTKSTCRDDLIEFGIYAEVYNIMAKTTLLNDLINAYQAKYNYTGAQIEKIINVVKYNLKLPKFSQGIVVVRKPSNFSWDIYILVW